MTEDSARQLAEGTAVQEGWDLAAYDPPVGHHDGDSWRFFYGGKASLVGNHFSVVESSRRARVIPGR